VATVDEELVEKSIGILSAADKTAARDAFRRVFSAWIR
jgi:hypothetical protein